VICEIAGERTHEFTGIKRRVELHHKCRRCVRCDQVRVEWYREAVAHPRCFPAPTGHDPMASPQGAQYSRLPRPFDSLACANPQVLNWRRSRNRATKKLDATLPSFDRARIKMRHRIPIAHLDHAQVGGFGQKVCPSPLKEVKMVGLLFTRKSAR
jgi:hypothetical protein